MQFSEPAFLFFFLPALLGLFMLPGERHRKPLLLLASLLFFAWAEKVGVLLGMALLNYLLGFWVEGARGSRHRRWALAAGVVLNLGLLVWFKYANLLGDTLNALLGSQGAPMLAFRRIAQPLAISFVTFQGISYLVDIHREEAKADRSFLGVALYLSFFPKLLAGPIVRWQDFARQKPGRPGREELAWGIQRFVVGLAKKLLLASSLGPVADQVFSLPPGQLGFGVAWLGALAYTLQIYLDFSGYSDMAVGLARIFGYRITENFNYPYVSASITEFWRRWHISLSTWFRDYLFFPLGANRGGAFRGYFNLALVFLLCGLWHGARWTFALWGLYMGLFLVLERLGLGRLLSKVWKPLQHVYALLAIVAGWVIFRAETPGGALHHLAAMAGLGSGGGEYGVALFLDLRAGLALLAGTAASLPWVPFLKGWLDALPARRPRGEGLRRAFSAAGLVLLGLLFLGSCLLVAAGTHNPFIYTQF